MPRPAAASAIPLPIVALNRATIVIAITVGLLLGLPVLTTALLVVLGAALAFGPRGSLVFRAGERFLAGPVALARAGGQTEEAVLMRINNGVAVVVLALAQVAFLAGQPMIGWTLAVVVVVAATVALAGYCVGCVVFFRLRMIRYRLGVGRVAR